MNVFRGLAAGLFAAFLVASNDSSSSNSNSGNASSKQGPLPDPALLQANARIPSGAPPAALQAEPVLPVPDGWPFVEGAPRTSGTGRYAHGAYYWTDFLYDANGAKGLNPPLHRIGTPSGGSLVYPSDLETHNNGSDIFRVGIGADDSFIYWRVDWQTMTDGAVPAAAFALDFTGGGTEAGDDWPGVPRLQSEGVDAVLLLSSDGAYLVNADGAKHVVDENMMVDTASRSFVAKVPRTALGDFSRPWTIRLAAGLNDPDEQESAFLDDMAAFRGLPHQPPVFNMGFRDYEDEPAPNNFWFDETQAAQLDSGDVTPFAIELDWSRLGETEPEDLRIGDYSSRWYVSSLAGRDLDREGGPQMEAGIFTGSLGLDATTAHPQFFDRVQPYGLYIPASYDPDRPNLLTLMLHSLTQNQNQYGTTTPNFQAAACEQRGSLCLTTMGRGPAGSYEGSAEVDLWEAWHSVAFHFNIDPERVISSGYSMGANGTIDLMIKYPEVFAGGVVLAGAREEKVAFLENLKWNGYYHAHGSFDELIPFPDARATVDAIRDLGYRYTFDHYLVEDHIIWTLKDQVWSAYEEAAKWMTGWLEQEGARKRTPGEILYRWRPAEVDHVWQIGPRGAWWISDITAADASQDSARISAVSGGRPEAVIADLEQTQGEPVFTEVTPSPALRETQSWVLDDAPAADGTVTLTLTNMAALTVDLAAAGVAGRDDKLVRLSTDQPLALTLTGLANGTRVRYGGEQQVVTGGRVTVHVDAGENQVIEFQ